MPRSEFPAPMKKKLPGAFCRYAEKSSPPIVGRSVTSTSGPQAASTTSASSRVTVTSFTTGRYPRS